jgi:hypothetical protein
MLLNLTFNELAFRVCKYIDENILCGNSSNKSNMSGENESINSDHELLDNCKKSWMMKMKITL